MFRHGSILGTAGGVSVGFLRLLLSSHPEILAVPSGHAAIASWKQGGNVSHPAILDVSRYSNNEPDPRNKSTTTKQAPAVQLTDQPTRVRHMIVCVCVSEFGTSYLWSNLAYQIVSSSTKFWVINAQQTRHSQTLQHPESLSTMPKTKSFTWCDFTAKRGKCISQVVYNVCCWAKIVEFVESYATYHSWLPTKEVVSSFDNHLCMMPMILIDYWIWLISKINRHYSSSSLMLSHYNKWFMTMADGFISNDGLSWLIFDNIY